MSKTFHPVGVVLGFNIGNVSDELIVLRLQHGAGREEVGAVAGVETDYVLSPDAALQLGQALVERATMALMPPGTRRS